MIQPSYSKRSTEVRCTGVYSCNELKIYREWWLFVTCIGAFSCHNATFFHLGGYKYKLTLYLYGPIIGSNMYKYPESNDEEYNWNLQTQLSVANEVVFFGYESTFLRIIASSDYSLWNVTIECNYVLSSWSSITCTQDYSNQFFVVDESCGDIVNINCNIINSTSSIDNHTIEVMDTITDIIDQFMKKYESECNNNNTANSNTSMFLDIGYPIYGESFIVNNEYRGAICCRGAESCAYSSSLISNLGNIFCTGDFSCGNSEYVYNGAYNDIQSLNDLNSVSIYCMAYVACLGSDLTSADKIICAAYSSCYYSEITGVQELYCTDSACDKAIVRQAKNIYIFGPQTEMTFFSNGVDMNIYFNGKDAGTDASLTCTEGDTCNINCTIIGACDASGTILTCNGKCFVTCPDGDGSSDCVDIALSTPPTAAPSLAPTLNPTIPPTNTPSAYPTSNPSRLPSIPPTAFPTMNPTVPPTFSAALTKKDIGMWFNWVLWCILAGVVVIVIGGFIDSQKCHRNELFRWHSIVLFGFYLIDFCSDIFLCMELFVLMMDANDEHSQFEIVYIGLFIASIVFIFIPVITTLVQLHREISKWLIDPILSRTEAQLWILTYARMLYIVAIISGSAFSAVTLLNSNLFRLNAFSMGLARFHRRIFRNKRFFSVVLLEVCLILCD